MSDLVGNPEDRFSHNEAQLVLRLSPESRVYAKVQLYCIKLLSSFKDYYIVTNCIHIVFNERQLNS